MGSLWSPYRAGHTYRVWAIQCLIFHWIAIISIENLRHQCNWEPSRGFHKRTKFVVSTWLPSLYFKYCQHYFSRVIRNELDQWSVQHWNVILLYPLISNFTFNNSTCSKSTRMFHPCMQSLWKLLLSLCALSVHCYQHYPAQQLIMARF